MFRLYLVVHDGSQAHNAHVHIVSLVGRMGLFMHFVHQSGAYSVDHKCTQDLTLVTVRAESWKLDTEHAKTGNHHLIDYW